MHQIERKMISEERGYNNQFALEYPDLDMLDSVEDGGGDNDDDDDAALLRARRMERLQQSSLKRLRWSKRMCGLVHRLRV